MFYRFYDIVSCLSWVLSRVIELIDSTKAHAETFPNNYRHKSAVNRLIVHVVLCLESGLIFHIYTWFQQKVWSTRGQNLHKLHGWVCETGSGTGQSSLLHTSVSVSTYPLFLLRPHLCLLVFVVVSAGDFPTFAVCARPVWIDFPCFTATEHTTALS